MFLDVREAAERWLAADPDPDTRAELQRLIEDDPDEVADRFADHLRFGTAGLRAELGAGPMRMNRVVVRQTASGLARWLPPHSTVVVAHDARRLSDVFAADTAALLSAAGHRVLMLPPLSATPLLAFAVRDQGAAAGVMVTASHNPAADNGYKVYAGDGAQLVPPADDEIEAAILASGLPPLDLPAPAPGGSISEIDAGLVDRYLVAALPDPTRLDLSGLRVAYTAMHGVGGSLVVRALERYGAAVHVVAEQFEPDGTFPTTSFPNPEEPGALDLLLALADRVDADVALANDPDADRLAAAVRGRDGRWAALSGDQLGSLLGDFRLRSTHGDRRLVATTVVSSSLLSKLADAHGVRSAETLTGFKWVVRPAIADPSVRFVFGYEEALGYAVNDVVRDKDGVSALVELCALVAELKRSGRTLIDRLDDLAREHGLHVSTSRSIRFPGPGAQAALGAVMAAVRADPPTELGGEPVEVVDYLPGGDLPPADLLRFVLVDGSRVQLRPSGTEPKLKVYVEVVGPVGADPDAVRPELARRADQLAAAGEALLAR